MNNVIIVPQVPEAVHGLDPKGEKGRGEALGLQVQVWVHDRARPRLHAPVELGAQPNVANRMTKIDGYTVRVEGLTYAKRS